MKLHELAKDLKTEFGKGLSEAEVTRRLAARRNELPSAPRASWLKRIWRHSREPMSLLLLAAAVVSFGALRKPGNALASAQS